MIGIVLLGGGLFILSLLLCQFRLFNYIIIVESFNVIVLLVSLLDSINGCRMIFVTIMSLFVIEISLMLIIVGVEIKEGCLRVSIGL
ncbi:NADH dehydrogenase subunit 4L (mitochondrion) [Schistosoma mansoni]|uniref:NADH dehydrogenase subunit 4L n=1 Tax=Schistosoma mansoni TaxID=6183 RepID=Q9B8X2_SCHMA|nr:NADH dehydrogenase subunit 4L [Schistosoma mansoni]AAG13165.2 NADH dehydrogenase subunit 4L [Schistosoma mansoni]AAS16661.1 NADH dehydrogenase subunit 4L [Schistosoma mansoni]AAS16665.1 NADH dehydrogenase subunit 4L [Schistosoma mansoni]AAS16667.1 NADH dehydrogenase subunit 4L [Schistosoma mansoni]AAS16669.1 NADH dehydrogenase subunit 4L [Schistosoma mansoni]|eukprot:NP_066213.2 NADH dehydrogenase subunit 4L (mitochondrion) [Schistosoma mansoni]